MNLKWGSSTQDPMRKSYKSSGTSSTAGNNEFLRTLLRGEGLREYYLIIDTFGGTTATYLKRIRKGLLKYFFPRHVLAKHKRDMRRMMREPSGIKLQHFSEILQDLHNLLPKFWGSHESSKIPQ